MDLYSHLSKARERARANAATRRANTVFTLSWRGGGASELLGHKALAAALNINLSSIPVLLSKGGGTSFDLMRTNPITGERDILTVTRTLPAKAKRASRARGRPSSVATLQRQLERVQNELREAEARQQLLDNIKRHKASAVAKRKR
jgi:hypothetical protein